MLHCKDEYLGESEVVLDGRIRTYLQSALGRNKNRNGEVDGIQEGIHMIMWTPVYMWNGRVTEATGTGLELRRCVIPTAVCPPVCLLDAGDGVSSVVFSTISPPS